jgi:hypothetical protein
MTQLPEIDADGTLVSGHQRVSVMILMGRGDEVINVLVPNRKLTDIEFRDYLVIANQTRGEFDYDILGSMFETDELLNLGFSSIDLGLSMPGIGDEPEEGSADKSRKPKDVTCPSCGHEFTV